LFRNYTDRTQRIRDAKSEAQKEIEEYRNQKEEEYKKFEGEVRYSF
jgi:Vacuolar (H+)-ATPase G subunit.